MTNRIERFEILLTKRRSRNNSVQRNSRYWMFAEAKRVSYTKWEISEKPQRLNSCSVVNRIGLFCSQTGMTGRRAATVVLQDSNGKFVPLPRGPQNSRYSNDVADTKEAFNPRRSGVVIERGCVQIRSELSSNKSVVGTSTNFGWDKTAVLEGPWPRIKDTPRMLSKGWRKLIRGWWMTEWTFLLFYTGLIGTEERNGMTELRQMLVTGVGTFELKSWVPWAIAMALGRGNRNRLISPIGHENLPARFQKQIASETIAGMSKGHWAVLQSWQPRRESGQRRDM